ncbi:MAG: glycoside hydrolase family 3 C-terminal domain-containing protein, partial [Spirochaetia bacterium]
SDWQAAVAAWLPGTEGSGVAEVLFGLYAPSGRLPMSWPAGAAGAAPAGETPGGTSAGVSSGAAGAAGAPLFPAGFGLAYR